tara:strand:+ start:365 stop:586 length:222 start_codon:yes stop_codon:yes gene_type:complete
MSNEIGDLVYVPSSTDLLQYEKSSPTKVFKVVSPTNLLILEKQENKLGVLFRGEVWYVDKRKVYDVKMGASNG